MSLKEGKKIIKKMIDDGIHPYKGEIKTVS